jgi:hypothetical protein
MKTKIIWLNLAILAAYMILLTAISGGGVLFTSIIPIAVHVFANFILFLVKIGSNKELGYTYLLCTFLVLLIGFPSCWFLASTAGGMRL